MPIVPISPDMASVVGRHVSEIISVKSRRDKIRVYGWKSGGVVIEFEDMSLIDLVRDGLIARGYDPLNVTAGNGMWVTRRWVSG